MTQRKLIQINHALSGVHGKQIKNAAQKITDSRKEILKRLQRKKKLASVIQDELYWYLEKYPDQKQGLHQEEIKKKKNKNQPQLQQIIKLNYPVASIKTINSQFLLKDNQTELKIEQNFAKWFQFKIPITDIQQEIEQQI